MLDSPTLHSPPMSAPIREANAPPGRNELAAAAHVRAIRDRLLAEGKIDGLDERVRAAVEQEIERARLATAVLRRRASLDLLARDRLDRVIGADRAGSLSPCQTLLALLEGTPQAAQAGRVSLAAVRLAFENRHIGALFAEIARERPYLADIIADERLNADLVTEMAELRQGGRPGLTGNDDARYLARVFATFAQISRADLNRRGCAISSLDGWPGAPMHDDRKLLAAGRDTWIATILPLLDLGRSFPEAATPEAAASVLSRLYDALTIGAVGAPAGSVAPTAPVAALATPGLLVFKDADAALAYQTTFGLGDAVSGFIAHQRRAARVAAAQDCLGANPESVLRSRLPADAGADIVSGADLDLEDLQASLDLASGLAASPAGSGAASIDRGIRSSATMAALGNAMLDAMPTDTITAAAAALFQPDGSIHGQIRQIDAILATRPPDEQRTIVHLLAEGFEGLIGHVLSQHGDAQDAPLGATSGLALTSFRWNKRIWWEDVTRAVAARTMAAELGLRARSEFPALPPDFRQALGDNGLEDGHWQAIRQALFRASNGHAYVTPDRVLRLPDAAVAHLGDAKAARRSLAAALRGFIAGNAGPLATPTGGRSAAERRRFVTLGGEAARFVAGFPAFPSTFSSPLPSAAAQGNSAYRARRRMHGQPHLGALIAGLTVAACISGLMRGALAGAALQVPGHPAAAIGQVRRALISGGGAGLYADHLAAQACRFDNPAVDNAVSPESLAALFRAAHAGDTRTGARLGAILDDTPFINLAYVRPALDVLFLATLREAAAPAYRKRA